MFAPRPQVLPFLQRGVRSVSQLLLKSSEGFNVMLFTWHSALCADSSPPVMSAVTVSEFNYGVGLKNCYAVVRVDGVEGQASGYKERWRFC